MMRWVRVAIIFRWLVELLILVFGVLPETGVWTTLALFMMVAEREFFAINPRHWERLA